MAEHLENLSLKEQVCLFRHLPADEAAEALAELDQEVAVDVLENLDPAIIGLICFSFGPMLFSLGISFTKWDVISAKEFIGLDNYKALFHDPLFFKSLKVTLYYTLLSVPLITCIPLLIAMLLNTKVKGISIFRAIFYVPSIVPIVASAAVWMYIYNPMYGLLNSILKALGLHTQNFIFSEGGAVPSLAVMALWAAGNTVVIYLAGLQGVSRQLYEAAEIDGAGAVARFFHITVPMMTPIIFYNFVMAIINSMQIFTQAYIMTDGGPRPDISPCTHLSLSHRSLREGGSDSRRCGHVP